jgi:G:T/U mismatch-specific DNA glycosylase
MKNRIMDSAAHRNVTTQILPDLLPDRPKLVFCGTAAGDRSRSLGAYYAGRGNKFWKTLHAIGLTDRLLAPSEWRGLACYGIGLTDLCKTEAGMDRGLTAGAFDVQGFREKLAGTKPLAVAFNGLKAARVFYGNDAVSYGRQPTSDGMEFWVMPSTSGAANACWDMAVWQQLAASLGDAGAHVSVVPDRSTSA